MIMYHNFTCCATQQGVLRYATLTKGSNKHESEQDESNKTKQQQGRTPYRYSVTVRNALPLLLLATLCNFVFCLSQKQLPPLM